MFLRLIRQFRYSGIGLITAIIIIFLIGWLSSHWILKGILKYGERMLEHVPIVKFIYKNVKKFSMVVLDSEKLLQQAVLVSYPHPDIKILGFVVSELSIPLEEKLLEEHVSVFIPMS